MGSTRRLVLVLCVGLFVSGLGAVWVQENGTASAEPDNPNLSVTDTTPTTTIVPATSSTSVAPPPAPPTTRGEVQVGRPGGPAAVPKNPYAPEPLRALGTIEIPKIGLTHPVYEGISLRTIDNGPGHWPGTALPGQVGNAVFAGHRVTHSHPFRNIDQLVPGDQVVFTINGVRTTYAVTGSEVVPPGALHIANQTAVPTATIFACHPPGSARFRYVVRMGLQSTG